MSIYIREKQLSPKALKVLSEVDNKSLFVREAIEFYVHHGKEILKELKDIKELINNVPNLSTSKVIKASEEIVLKDMVSIQDDLDNSKEMIRQIDTSNISNDNITSVKDEITDEKKREIEKQLLRSVNMFS